MTVRPSSTDCCGLSLFSAQAPPHRVPVLKGGSTIPSLVVTTVVAAAAGKAKPHSSRHKARQRPTVNLFPFITVLLFRSVFPQGNIRRLGCLRAIVRLARTLRHSRDITSFPVAKQGRGHSAPRELHGGRSNETQAGKLEEMAMIS